MLLAILKSTTRREHYSSRALFAASTIRREPYSPRALFVENHIRRENNSPRELLVENPIRRDNEEILFSAYVRCGTLTTEQFAHMVKKRSAEKKVTKKTFE